MPATSPQEARPPPEPRQAESAACRDAAANSAVRFHLRQAWRYGQKKEFSTAFHKLSVPCPPLCRTSSRHLDFHGLEGLLHASKIDFPHLLRHPLPCVVFLHLATAHGPKLPRS